MARKSDKNNEVVSVAKLIPRPYLLKILIGALIGATIFAAVGWLSEVKVIALPRLEPLFGSPFGTVIFFFLVIGAGLGGLIAGLVTLKRAEPTEHTRHKREEKHDKQMLKRMLALRLPAWLIAVIIAGILMTATSYIWILSAAYGPGSDQDSRIGYTLKNVQRIPGDTPQTAAVSIAQMFNNSQLAASEDLLTTLLLAPVAASERQTLVYGAATETADLNQVIAQSLEVLNSSSNVVVISRQELEYAFPAAYAAARFKTPILPLNDDGTIPDVIGGFLENATNIEFFVAAPGRLISDSSLEQLRQYGSVERWADDDIYKHALVWATSRKDDFGWGLEYNYEYDIYCYFTMTNPKALGFAAAGMPMAYLGNHGPLIYTEQADLSDVVDQYFWRVAPDYFTTPAEGPYANVRVVGGPDSVSYNTQARADLALEIHQYRNHSEGASGLSLIAWAWFFIGLFGAIWAHFVIPARLPDTSFYPKLYWPLAILVLGPLGLILFLLSYHNRPIAFEGDMTRYARPPWARAVSATIMTFGVGMSLMIASMYVFQAYGMPLFTTFEFTSLFWLGSPMGAVMWFVMIIPATILTAIFYVGPMMADMHKKSYLKGLRASIAPVVITMFSSSVGMFWSIWYMMTFQDLSMGSEELWFWVVLILMGAAIGFFTAYIPNYLMAKAGWKEGET